MSKQDILAQLKELFNVPEVMDGFPSQAECVSWANRTAPLLMFNRWINPVIAKTLL
jgi:hypothetical protein